MLKPILLSVSALALLAAAASTQASAQAPSVLQPKGGWSVTKMDAGSNGAGPYCALARQYDKNIIFTLGRNLTDEYSLAVDFQKAQMNPETAYKLTLAPGAGQTRAFNLMPLSERAMVIRLGWDESFFKALDTSRMLRVGIGDVDYSFNMPDIAAGQKDLQNCIDGLKTAKADSAPAADQSAPGDVLNADASAQAGFSARKGVDEENKGAKAVVMVPPPRKKDADAHAVIESAEAVPAPEVIATNVTPLPPGTGPLKPMPGADGDRALLKQVADLRAENDRLAKSLEQQRKTLEKSFQESKDSNAMAEMQEKLRLLENENKRLSGGASAGTVSAQAAAAPAAAKPDAAALDALRADLAKAQAEKTKLETDIAALRKQPASATLASAAPVAADKAEMDKAARRYTEAEREVQRLAKLLEEERKTKTAAVAAAPAAKIDPKLDAENKKLKDQIAALEKQVKGQDMSKADMTKVAQELATLKNRFVESERERESLRAENLKLSNDLKTAQASVTGKQTDLQKQLSAAQAEARDAQQKLAALDTEVKKLRATVALDTYRQPPAKEAQIDAQAAALNATEPAAGFEPPPLQPAMAQAVSAPSNGAGYGEASLKSLLSRANVPLKGGVRRMADGVYGWKTDKLMGRAEIAPAGEFARNVDTYINKAKSQCKGDFAAIPSAQAQGIANVEIACVDGAGSTAGSVAFFETDGSFVAVTHEASAENMEAAMDARDQVAKAR